MSKNININDIINNLKEGDKVMCSNYTDKEWKLKYFQEIGKYGVYVRNTPEVDEHKRADGYTYIIPLEYFNLNDIESSLEYDIQTYK